MAPKQSKSELKEDIFHFILFSQALCEKSERIFFILESKTPKERKERFAYINDCNVHFLQLTGNLFMNQCILEIGSLLDKNQKQKTLYGLLSLNQTDAKSALDIIAEKFKSKKLLIMRHQFIAHRSKSSSGGPISIIFSTYKKEIVQNCKEIITDVIDFWSKYIGARPGNNMFMDKMEAIDDIAELLLNKWRGDHVKL